MLSAGMSLCRGSCNSNMQLTYKREALPWELQQHVQSYWYSKHNFTRAIMWIFDTPMIKTSSEHYQIPVDKFPRLHAQKLLLTFFDNQVFGAPQPTQLLSNDDYVGLRN